MSTKTHCDLCDEPPAGSKFAFIVGASPRITQMVVEFKRESGAGVDVCRKHAREFLENALKVFTND